MNCFGAPFLPPFYGHHVPNDQNYRQWSTGNINDNIYDRRSAVNAMPWGPFVPNSFDTYYPVMPNVGYNPGMVGPSPEWAPSYDGRKVQPAGMMVNSRSTSAVSIPVRIASQGGPKDKSGWVQKRNWDNRASQEHRNQTGSDLPKQSPRYPAKGPPFRQNPSYRSVCTLCRQNGECSELFLDHSLKDKEGKVACPILRAYVCPYCSATGDFAHTKSYCPLKPTKPLAIKLKNTLNSCGRFRK